MKRLFMLGSATIVMFVTMLELSNGPCACGWKPSMAGYLVEETAHFFGIDNEATRYPS